jgi:hypothetical protein
MFGLSGVILIYLGDFNPSFSGKEVVTWSFVKVPLIVTNLVCSSIFKTLAILFKYDKTNYTYFKIKCI